MGEMNETMRDSREEKEVGGGMCKFDYLASGSSFLNV